MPKLLAEVYRLQAEFTDLDAKERRLLKMFAHLLESHYDVKEPRNRLTFEEYERSQDGGSYSTACCKITEGALEGVQFPVGPGREDGLTDATSNVMLVALHLVHLVPGA